MHIYNVEDVTDRDTPSTISLLWDETFDLAALEINGYDALLTRLLTLH